MFTRKPKTASVKKTIPAKEMTPPKESTSIKAAVPPEMAPPAQGENPESTVSVRATGSTDVPPTSAVSVPVTALEQTQKTPVSAWPSILFGRAVSWLTGGPHAQYGVAMLRILLSGTLLIQLIVNFPFRSYLWGSASAWSQEIATPAPFPLQRSLFGPVSDSTTVTVAYCLLFGACVALLLGWHTRVATFVTLTLFTLMTFSDGIYMDQSDNLVRMLLIYGLFLNLGGRWSLDARYEAALAAKSANSAKKPNTSASAKAIKQSAAAEARSGWWRATGFTIHNLALCAVALHLCLIYVSSAMFKIQGDAWQNGTAVYFPLQVPHFRPFPELSDFAVQGDIRVNIATYAAVYLQLFFPFLLLNKWTRRVALVGVVGMHASIAVLMGLPFFSSFMLAGDAIFVSTATYIAVSGWVSARVRRVLKRDSHAESHPASAATQIISDDMVASSVSSPSEQPDSQLVEVSLQEEAPSFIGNHFELSLGADGAEVSVQPITPDESIEAGLDLFDVSSRLDVDSQEEWKPLADLTGSVKPVAPLQNDLLHTPPETAPFGLGWSDSDAFVPSDATWRAFEETVNASSVAQSPVVGEKLSMDDTLVRKVRDEISGEAISVDTPEQQATSLTADATESTISNAAISATASEDTVRSFLNALDAVSEATQSFPAEFVAAIQQGVELPAGDSAPILPLSPAVWAEGAYARLKRSRGSGSSSQSCSSPATPKSSPTTETRITTDELTVLTGMDPVNFADARSVPSPTEVLLLSSHRGVDITQLSLNEVIDTASTSISVAESGIPMSINTRLAHQNLEIQRLLSYSPRENDKTREISRKLALYGSVLDTLPPHTDEIKQVPTPKATEQTRRFSNPDTLAQPLFAAATPTQIQLQPEPQLRVQTRRFSNPDMLAQPLFAAAAPVDTQPQPGTRRLVQPSTIEQPRRNAGTELGAFAKLKADFSGYSDALSSMATRRSNAANAKQTVMQPDNPITPPLLILEVPPLSLSDMPLPSTIFGQAPPPIDARSAIDRMSASPRSVRSQNMHPETTGGKRQETAADDRNTFAAGHASAPSEPTVPVVKIPVYESVPVPRRADRSPSRANRPRHSAGSAQDSGF